MLNYVIRENETFRHIEGLPFEEGKIIWVDLIEATEDEKKEVEIYFKVELFTKQETEEIESSSRYIESEDEIGINMNFVSLTLESYQYEPVSFIVKNKVLITQRNTSFHTFKDTYRKLKITKPEEGDDIFLNILDTRIDFDADLIENITEQISIISKKLVKSDDLNRELLLKITSLQETTIAIRENIVEKQRILSSVMKSRLFPKEDTEKIRIMFKDVSSLLEHTSFNFERLEFLQNTFLGLLDMEQNRVIKIFTVVTVVFMPPTLIASMYGMNFRFMPELNQTWGYPFAIVLMILSSAFTLMFFKRKKWL
jgi:magnesium transporter